MNLKSIDEVTKRIREKGEGGKLPYVEIGDINVLTKGYSLKDKPSVAGCLLTHKGNILISRVRPTRGAVSLIKEEGLSVSSAFTILEPVNENLLLNNYLFYILAYNQDFYNYLGRMQKGTSYPSCKETDILKFKIPIPSLPEQKRIVEILEKADNLRKKRQEADEQSNKTIQSIFLEMFGNPLTNKRGWAKKKLSDSDIEIIDGDRGKNYPKQRDFLDNGWCLFLNTKNVTKAGFKFDTTMFISREKDQQLRKGKLQRNDIVLTTRGTVGNVALYDKSIPFDNVRINSGMVILRANLGKFNLVFLEALLNSKYFHSQKDRIVSGCAQPQLPIRHLKDIELFIPPIDQQQKFANLVQKVEKIKEFQHESKKELDNLFNSLMQKVFSGGNR